MKGWVNSFSHPAGITDGKLSILLKLSLKIGQKKKKKKSASFQNPWILYSWFVLESEERLKLQATSNPSKSSINEE